MADQPMTQEEAVAAALEAYQKIRSSEKPDLAFLPGHGLYVRLDTFRYEHLMKAYEEGLLVGIGAKKAYLIQARDSELTDHELGLAE